MKTEEKCTCDWFEYNPQTFELRPYPGGFTTNVLDLEEVENGYICEHCEGIITDEIIDEIIVE